MAEVSGNQSSRNCTRSEASLLYKLSNTHNFMYIYHWSAKFAGLENAGPESGGTNPRP